MLALGEEARLLAAVPRRAHAVGDGVVAVCGHPCAWTLAIELQVWRVVGGESADVGEAERQTDPDCMLNKDLNHCKPSTSSPRITTSYPTSFIARGPTSHQSLPSLGRLTAREGLSVCARSVCLSLGALASPCSCSVMKAPLLVGCPDLHVFPIAAPPMEPPAEAEPGGRSANLVKGWGEGEG